MSDLKEKITEWADGMERFRMPLWEELPELELYMDQVVVLLNKYLIGYGTATVTPSMINNYVKLKALPAPNKKRYNRIHLAYLLMICSLKYTLSITQIQKIIPVYDNEKDVLDLYRDFAGNYKKSVGYLGEQLKAAMGLYDNNGFDIIISGAVTSGIIKLFAEELIKKTE